MNNTTSDNSQKLSSIVDNIKNILSDFNTKLIFIFVSLFVICHKFIMDVIAKCFTIGILSKFNDNIAENPNLDSNKLISYLHYGIIK